MKIKWIVVADRIQARIFRSRPLTLIKILKNPLGREKNKALRNDKPGWGKSQFSGSAGIHSMSGEKDPHEDAAIQFARRLCRFLERNYEARLYDQLTIAAEPKMMGRIRRQLAPQISDGVQWIQKDFGHLNRLQIGASLGLSSERRSV
jgi:protein required for attachment to host cells